MAWLSVLDGVMGGMGDGMEMMGFAEGVVREDEGIAVFGWDCAKQG